ncbi:MAG: transaldolase family protein [Erysipelotrichaceae bacterium]
MNFLLDTADLEEIKEGLDIFPLAGVTTNPSILAKSGQPMFKQLNAIRQLIGKDRMLHAQVMGDTCEEMLLDAAAMVKAVDKDLYIKVPVSREGLKAIRELKKQNYHVTATALFTYEQAILASRAGADFVAPYISRMMRNGIDAYGEVEAMEISFEENGMDTQVLAASFQNSDQIASCIASGAGYVTAKLVNLYEMIDHPLTDDAIQGFKGDWQKAYDGVLPQNM